MAKQIVMEDTEEGGLSVALQGNTPTRKFKGSDADPTDAETGETVFDELSPRFNLKLEEAAAEQADADAEDDALPDDDVVVEDEDEPAKDEQESDTDEVDEVDEVDEKPGKKSKFEKRLARADRLVEETRAEAAALRERLDRQEAATRAQADEAKYTSEKTSLDTELKSAREVYRKAIEDGNTDAQVEANEKIADLKGDLKVLEVRHIDAKLAVEASKTAVGNSEIVKTKSGQWVRKHSRYNTDKEFAATARTVDQQVSASGLNPETDAYYKELDRRMAKYYPKEFKVQGKAEENVPAKRKHPASGIRRDEGGRAAAKPDTKGTFQVKNGRVILTPRNIQTMRDFSMDPTNPNDVRDFVEQNR